MVSDKEDVTPNSDTICNEVIDGERDVLTVTCGYRNRNVPSRGRYVTIRRKTTVFEKHVMNFCEVEVLSWRLGFCGKDLDNDRDCSRSCGRCVEETCRVSDGFCYTGCQDGFWETSVMNNVTARTVATALDVLLLKVSLSLMKGVKAIPFKRFFMSHLIIMHMFNLLSNNQ